MRYGSICSGVDSATLAWKKLGWEPVFFAEVEPFPCAVLHRRFGASRPLRSLAPRYKACGNGMCVNVIEWLGRRIQQITQME